MHDNKCLLLLKNVINKISANNNIKNLVVLAILLIIHSILNKDFKFYLLVNNIVTIAVLTALIYVNMIREKFINKTFIKRLQMTYLILIMIIVLNIICIILFFENSSIIYFFLLFSVQAVLEYYEIENIFQFKSSSLKSICISYFILFVVLFIMLKRNNGLLNNDTISIIIGSVVINIIISIGVCISTLENMLRNRICFSGNEFRRIIFYMLSILVNYIGIAFLSLGDKRIAEVILIIKCVSFYKFHSYVINKLLSNSLEEINNNIEIATKTKKELNSILKKRNVILNEANVMLEKSRDKNNKMIDSIYGGVFLFYLNKLQYSNKKILRTLRIIEDEIFRIDLRMFLKKYFDITLQDIEQSSNYICRSKMKNVDLEVEIFLTNIDEKNKILYVHDISEINANKKIREVLEEYLEDDEIKKEFFANISHELKTPINLIFSALQVNQIYLKENNMEGFNKNRKIIKQNCLRLIRTINNFIDANKISEGYIVPEFKIYNIVELVESVSIASNKYIQLIENKLTFDAEEEEIYVSCDKEMIIRIILNILSNSVKYGIKGGNINVRVGIYKNDYVRIKIKNDGAKIDQETIPYIFDKFTKLNKAFNRLKEGSGLGLFLTKALTELQGGNIKLVSDDSGNEYIITIPRVIQPFDIELIHEGLEINQLEEKIDVEFSDIYIE